MRAMRGNGAPEIRSNCNGWRETVGPSLTLFITGMLDARQGGAVCDQVNVRRSSVKSGGHRHAELRRRAETEPIFADCGAQPPPAELRSRYARGLSPNSRRNALQKFDMSPKPT